MVARRALVTGATGGLGRCLVPALVNAGYQVRATGRNKRIGKELAQLGCEFVESDLTTELHDKLVKNCQVVFHLAALTAPWGALQAFHNVNVKATRQLLDASTKMGCETFIFASTPSVYTTHYDREGLTESDPVASPLANHYTTTKYRAECDVILANGEALSTVVLRPRAIVSQFDTVLLPRILRAARRGILPLPNHGKAYIELTDARDVVSAFILADQKHRKLGGCTFNVSSGQPISVRDIMSCLFKQMNMKVRCVSLPGSLLSTIARCLEVIAQTLPGSPEPPITQYSINTLAHTQTFDISMAQSCLDWHPRFSPEQAIIHSLKGMYPDA